MSYRFFVDWFILFWSESWDSCVLSNCIFGSWKCSFAFEWVNDTENPSFWLIGTLDYITTDHWLYDMGYVCLDFMSRRISLFQFILLMHCALYFPIVFGHVLWNSIEQKTSLWGNWVDGIWGSCKLVLRDSPKGMDIEVCLHASNLKPHVKNWGRVGNIQKYVMLLHYGS